MLTSHSGVFGSKGGVYIFEATAVPLDFVTTNGLSIGGGFFFEVDWGDGMWVPYPAGFSGAYGVAIDGGSPLSVIRVRSTSTVTQCRFLSDTFTSIDVNKSSTLTSADLMCVNLTNLASFAIADTSNITSFGNTWQDCSSLTSFPLINTSAVTGTGLVSTWLNCSGLTSFPLIDTSSVTSLLGTWSGCTSLASFPLIDTSLVTNFGSTFKTTALTSLPAIDTSSGESFNRTFKSCASLVCLSTLDTTSATDTTDLFLDATLLTSPNASEQTQLANIGSPNGLDYVNGSACP